MAINPRSSLAQAYYGLFLATERRAEEAVTHTRRACDLDPLSSLVHGLASSTNYTLGRYDAAERAARQALERQPDYMLGLWLRGLALCGLGRNEEAIESLERVATLSRAPIFMGVLGLGYARAGRIDDATRLLREMEDRGSRGEFVPAFAPLAIHVGLGDLPAMRRTLAAGPGGRHAPVHAPRHRRPVPRGVPRRSRDRSHAVRSVRLVTLMPTDPGSRARRRRPWMLVVTWKSHSAARQKPRRCNTIHPS